MYLATHTRPDIIKEVSYLASFSNNPGPIVRSKLDRVLSYIHATPELGICFRQDELKLHIWADAAFAIHTNMRSHTGIFMSLGSSNGPILVKSKSQRLVTTSSTEAEIYAVAHAGKYGIEKSLS